MALAEITRKMVENELGSYCEKRFPAHLKDQLRLSFEIRGNFVTLFEDRPGWRNPEQWTHSKIAQFRFETESLKWTLFCSDRNQKWHHYSGPIKDFRKLLAEVDEDKTGIFFG